MNKQRIFFTVILMGIFIYFLSQPSVQNYHISGKTMGTTYSISVWGKTSLSKEDLKLKVDNKLQSINAVASTWIDTSQISQFNASASTDPVKVDEFLISMINMAQSIHKESGGAFDVTIAPLINLWGFDAQGRVTKSPSASTLKNTLIQIGSTKIHTDKKNVTITKDQANLSINLSAIAKGGGVDKVADLLHENGFENYLVEIGGEIYAKGTKQDSTLWRVGIEIPKTISAGIRKIINLNNTALATSGDYRNYFESNGVRYSHIINPKTGTPISHRLASVSVLANNTALADGWATALMVLGEKKGIAIANKNNLAVFMIVRENGKFKNIISQAWLKKIGE